MKRSKKLIVCFILAVFSICMLASPVLAYSLMTQGYYKPDIDVGFYSGLPSMYRSATADAIDAWNSKAISPVFLYTKLESQNLVYAGTSDQSWYGAYVVRATSSNDPKHTALKFEIYYNMNLCEGTGKTHATRQSVACHELGHAIGLDDLSSGQVIMSNARNRELVTTPQSDDVKGAQASW